MRLQFNRFPEYTRQAHVLSTKRGKTLQPTKGLLAHRVAREMEKFIVRFGALVLRAEADT